MRSLPICLLLLAVAGAAAARDESLDELKAKAQSASPQDRPRIYVEIAEVQLRTANQLYKDGEVEKARAAVDDIVTYSEKARNSATETKKQLKNVEIRVRKIAERLRDIKGTLAIEDQPVVDQAVQRLEAVRTSLLDQMFAKDKNKDKK
jgi:hypothetical protein